MMAMATEQVKVVWDYPGLGYLGSCDLYSPYALTKAQWSLGYTPAICDYSFGSTTDATAAGPTYNIRGNFGWNTRNQEDSTIFIPKNKLPRYIAWVSFSSFITANFPVAHIGRCYQSEASADTHLFGTQKSIRKINSSLKHIFDLQELFAQYSSDYPEESWCLAIRVGYGKIVGSNDLQALQSYLNNL